MLGVLQQRIVKKKKSKESDSEKTVVAGKVRKQFFLQEWLQKFTWLGEVVFHPSFSNADYVKQYEK